MNTHYNNYHILIVGGGTAGWMAANLIAKKWQNKRVDITVIESSEIPIIGVGEGSTPYLRKLFKTLEIPESEWMQACNATYKNGISFQNWSTIKGYERYFHPFSSELDTFAEPQFEQATIVRRKGESVRAHPDDYFFMAELARQGKKPISPQHFPFNNVYGYHFDSALLGQFLKRNATTLGVKHIDAKVVDALKHTNGELSSVITHQGEHLTADFFVDCSGFKALLIQEALNVPFKKFNNNLFNDSAIALPTKRHKNEKPMTVSKAFSNGWAWRIPLSNRVGNGYVYSSAYQNKESAALELCHHLNVNIEDVDFKYLTMKVGRVESPWYKNCLAIGLSQGFIEPLEATALHLVQNSIEQFIELFEDGGFTNKNHFFYNNQINYSFERVRDYIVLHYVLNSRHDTQYWEDARHVECSDSLKGILNAWFSGDNLAHEINRQDIASFYASLSWHTIFSGYGVYPPLKKAQPEIKLSGDTLTRIKNFNQCCALNFPFI